ncbi:MAG: single-stranded-DNA-specific exonuclease RecJ [bacterium]
MRWTLKEEPNKEHSDNLQESLQVSPIVAKLLVQRGITTFDQAKSFFRPNLSELHDPFLMKDMDVAVKRIEKAIANNERILVYGDYDVDGTTAVSLMYTYLVSRTKEVATYIPDRYNEGYGVSFEGIDYADDNEFTLIIALDCGVKAIDKVAYAKEKEIDFIICDHHRPSEKLPEAIAVLDPKREDCHYPYNELCGCGVGFKLIQALEANLGNSVEGLVAYLDLVVTAIAADIVPMTGENRVLAYYGLKVINESPRIGIKALLHQVKKEVFTITDVVFIIAPRINAAGRMKHGNHAVTLLTETDFNLAASYATDINQFNLDRRELDKKITQEALSQIEENDEKERFTTVVYDESWHKGVIGIVASRLTETYYRPTLVFTKSGEKLAASARSVRGFDVYNALDACSEFIEQFGGHKYAAGLTLKEENYIPFKEAFEKVVKETITEDQLIPEIKIDAHITLEQVNHKLFRILDQFAPFGPGNMKPVFVSENLLDTGYAKCVGEDQKHLRFTATQNRSDKFTAIGFNLGHHLPLVQNQKLFKAVYSLDENHWNGKVSLQLKLKDLKPQGIE